MSQKQKGFKSVLYLLFGLLQGVCLVTLPAASTIFTSSRYNGLSESEYGFLFVAQIVAVIFFTLLMPAFLKKFKRRTLFTWGVFFNLFYLGCLFLTSETVGRPITSFYLLFLASAFLGAGFGCLVSILNMLVVELYPDHTDTALAALHGLLGTGAAVSPLLVSYFHRTGQWVRSPMIVSGLLVCLFLICWIFRGISEPTNSEQIKSESAKKSSWLPLGAMFFLAIIMVYGVIESIMGNWTTLFLTSEKRLSIHASALGLSAFWAFLTVGRIVTSFLAYKVDSRIFYRAAPLITLVGLLLILKFTSEQELIGAFIIVGLGCSSFFPLSLSFAVRYYPAYREVLSSLGLAALMMGVGFGSFGMGMLRNAGILELSQFMNLACVCAGIMLAAVVPLTRSITD